MTDRHLSSAILLCAHGSKYPNVAVEFGHIVKRMQETCPNQVVEGAFLEFNTPSITDGLQNMYDRGIRRIIVQPLTLYKATHTNNDIPKILASFMENHPDIFLHYGKALGLIDPIIDAAVSAINTVLPNYDLNECKLIVVGRGSQDRIVADQTINLCRKLHDRFDFGDSRYCYSSGNVPSLATALTQAGMSHYPHVIILPFLLFSGRLLSDIYAEIDIAAEKYPDFTFHKTPHLGSQHIITEAISYQIHDIMTTLGR